MKQLIETLSLPLLKRLTTCIPQHVSIGATNKWDEQDYAKALCSLLDTHPEFTFLIIDELSSYVTERYQFNHMPFGKDDYVEWKNEQVWHTLSIGCKFKPNGQWSTATFSFGYEDDGTDQPATSSHTLFWYPEEDHALLEWYVLEHEQVSKLYKLFSSTKHKTSMYSFFKTYYETETPDFRYLHCRRAFSDRYGVYVELPGVSDIHLCILVDVKQPRFVNAMLVIEDKEIYGFHDSFDKDFLTHYVFEQSPCRLQFLYEKETEEML